MYEGSVRDRKPPFIFFSPQKAKNDDKVTFLERISQKYLVTFGNFCTFAADFNTHVYAKNK